MAKRKRERQEEQEEAQSYHMDPLSQQSTFVEKFNTCDNFYMQIEEFPDAETYEDIPNTKRLKKRFTKMRTFLQKAAGGEESVKQYLKFGFPEAFEDSSSETN